ncbi:hypothetical protein HDU67_008646 [Dinochytrium kinnereticum]|nr:hypothetical protein HDU67_008646 [Dinochytrium kinnereticum]
MKHGVKVFQKKLNRSPAHRLALLRNLASSLLIHGRIETTLPKAKFLRHQADKLVEWAKSGTIEDTKKAQRFLFEHGETLPKLRLLAARFQGRDGGYTRIIRNGLKAKGDKSQMAIVEYVDNKNDTYRLLAKKHLTKVKKDLSEVKAQRYEISKINLTDPVTNQTVQFTRQKLRPDRTSSQTKRLVRKEAFYEKLVNKLGKSVKSGPIAQEKEQKELEVMQREKDQRDKEKLQRLQQAVDKLPSEKKEKFIKRVATIDATADPLLSHRAAAREGKTKTVVMGMDGKLRWIRSSQLKRWRPTGKKEAEDGDGTKSASKSTDEDGGGLFTKLIGGLGKKKLS